MQGEWGRRDERSIQTFDKLEGSSRQQELSLIFPQVCVEGGGVYAVLHISYCRMRTTVETTSKVVFVFVKRTLYSSPSPNGLASSSTAGSLRVIIDVKRRLR